MKSTRYVWSLGSYSKRIYELLILIFSAMYVYSQTSVRIGVSEDPVFHNGSYLVNNLFSAVGDDQRGLLTEGYKTLAIPYGVASWILNLFTSDPVWHFRYQLFIHVLIILFSIYFALITISSRYVALLLAVFAFSTQAFYEQVLYSIGASQVLLIASATALFITLEQVSNKRFILFSCGSLLLSISLWSNIPQLLSTWLAVLLIMVLGVVVSEHRKVALLRSALFCLVALFIYLAPMFSLISDFQFYNNSIEQFSARGGFSNSGPFHVLQGLGKFSLNDHTWRIPHYREDLIPWRQSIRAIPATLVFLTFLYFTLMKPDVKFLSNTRIVLVFLPAFAITISASNLPLIVWVVAVLALAGIAQLSPIHWKWRTGTPVSTGLRMFFAFSVLSLLFFYLSLIGHYNWYWVLRQNLTLLTMFREPWAKFSIPFVFFLCCAMAVMIRNFQLHLRNSCSMRSFKTFHVLIAALVVAISMPMFSNEPGMYRKGDTWVQLELPSLETWRSIETEIQNSQNLLSDRSICIINLDSGNSTQMALRTRFAMNSAISRAVTISPPNKGDCTTNQRYLKLIIPLTNQLGDSANFIFDVLNETCILKRSSHMVMINNDCSVTVSQSLISVQIVN
jgi:hypothetical protein